MTESTPFHFTSVPPLTLYIHVPWCVRKCPYCDFNSHHAPDAIPETDYVDALLRDLEPELPLIWGRRVEAVFIGGGTPSLFSPEAYARLFSGLRALLNLQPGIEITLEANPGTLEQGRFAEYRAAGINRLSIGVQSFNEAHLQSLGRIHGREEAIRAAEAAHAAGYDNFNLDLMFGLPGQDRQQALADVDQAVALEPSHISYYQLTLEPNTYFHSHPPQLPADERIWEMQQAGQARLAGHGYAQYEVSAYARDRYHCQHNLNYWRFGDYLGIGAGAHAKLTLPAEQRIQRRWRERQPKAYLQGAGGADIIRSQELTPADAVIEFMMNALRLTDGFELPLFTERTGLPQTVITTPLGRAEELGLIERSPLTVRPTTKGQQYLNELLQLFMLDEDQVRRKAQPINIINLTQG